MNYGTSDRKRSKITTLLQRRASELANLPYSLAQRVTEFESNIAEYVEATVYSYQKNDLGGITTQSWLNGSFFGTANAKATSALLVAYNDQLIHNLHNTAR